MKAPTLFIISGTSGSGKTIALQVLEDLGFYCIDNLPASLVFEMASNVLSNDSEYQHYAIGIDSRNKDFIGDLKSSFEQLNSLNIETRVIFIDAQDDTLLKRFSETRRKHPLSNKDTTLIEAIAKERTLLEHLSDIADKQINTTNTTPHELRSIIRDDTASSDEHSLTLLFQSFGFKYGAPADADYVFDIRCLPNPHWEPELKLLTGLDEPVRQFFYKQDVCDKMHQQIQTFIDTWLPSFIQDNRNYITVAIGCTGGQHRSVYISSLLAQYFKQNTQIQTLIRHRELRL